MEIVSENLGYSPDEMIVCGRCAKANPPNRASCFYCAAELEVPEELTGALKLNLRPLENWENGFNVVLLSSAKDGDAVAVARYLKYDVEHSEKMLSSEDPFPLVRLQSEREAESAVAFLDSIGVRTRVVSDIDLKIGKPNMRLRSVSVDGEVLKLTLFNTGEVREISPEDLAMIVVGRITETKAESVEKRKRKETKVLAASETASDEVVVDLYPREGECGFRVQTRGFDFSGLGARKGLLALENISSLVEMIRSFAPDAKYVDGYDGLMGTLSLVWDVERTTDFEGMKRTGLMKSGFANVMKTTNLEQFTKFSRLQRLLL